MNLSEAHPLPWEKIRRTFERPEIVLVSWDVLDAVGTVVFTAYTEEVADALMKSVERQHDAPVMIKLNKLSEGPKSVSDTEDPSWPFYRVRYKGSHVDYVIHAADTRLDILDAFTVPEERNRGQQRILYKWLYDNYPHLTIAHGELPEDGEKYLKRYQRNPCPHSQKSPIQN